MREVTWECSGSAPRDWCVYLAALPNRQENKPKKPGAIQGNLMALNLNSCTFSFQ